MSKPPEQDGYAALAIKLFKTSHSTPIAAFFAAGKKLGVTVTVQGLSEAAWKALAKKNMERVFDKLDAVIKVTVGSKVLRFDWLDLGKLALRK